MVSRTRFLAVLLAIALVAGPAQADTLREALQRAYDANPTLTGARAQQRANDENSPIQRSRGLPTVNATADYLEFVQRSSNNFTSPLRQAAGGVSVSVPIYQGGAVRNAVRAADTRILAGQENLRDTESSVFSQVVGAYMDVIRDEAIVALNKANVGVLQVNLEATQDRFQVGDLTRTDVAQSQSRLVLAQGQLENAQAQLINSRETYIRYTGAPPAQLEPPPPLPNLPASPDAATTFALDHNPGLLSARRTREATRFDVGTARAARLPRIEAIGQGNYSNYLGTLGGNSPGLNFSQTSKTAQVGAQLTLPLYQGGLPSAQVRQAQALESQAIEREIEVERSIIAQTRAAYASWQASNTQITSYESAVAAARLSLEGVRAENTVGSRTILDILDAEQEFLNAQVNLVTARRNAYVAGFALLAAMGQGEARDLGLDGGALYDPAVNYRRVKNNAWDWNDGPKPLPQATRTVDSPAQTSAVTGRPAR